MRTGWKMMVAAAGLALAGVGPAMAQAPAAAPARTDAVPAATAASEAAAPQVAVVNSAAPAVTPAPGPMASPTAPALAGADPALAQDGAFAMTPKPHIGIPTDGAIGLQPQVTKNGQRAHWFHDTILVPVITLISLLVLALLIFAMIKFRRSDHREPSKTSHNTLIEVIWTLVPVIILVLIAVPSIGLLSAQFKPAPAGAVTLKAIGNQWYWSYQYPDNGGFEVTANLLKECNDPALAKGGQCRKDADGPRLLAVDNRIVLPVGVPIRLITTSNDVIHSWAVPAFWIKLDAVPGRLNETSFTIEKPGVYFGQCSELCGARHAYMPIAVEAVSPAEFAAWVKAKGGTIGGAPNAGNGQAAPPAAPAGNVADDATQPGPTTAPVTNTTAAPATTSQPATANPAAVGGVKN